MTRADHVRGGSLRLDLIPGPWRDRDQANRAIALAVTLTIVAVAGAVVAISPIVVLVACLVTVAAVAITSPSARFAIVVAGGLLVLGSSDQLDASKLAYLGWVAVSTVVAIAALAAEGEHRRLGDFRALLLAPVAVVVAIALSLVVALSAGTPMIDSMRDAAPYGLFAIAPLLAWDGARSRLGPRMEAVIVTAGLMASVGFAVTFLERRGIADLPFATLGLGSGSLATLAFVVATAAILSRRPRRILWFAVAAVVLTLLLITGTRSVLVLLVGPIAMVFAHGQRLRRVVRLAGAAAAVGLAILALAFLAGQSSFIDVARLVDRIDSLVHLGTNLSADPSYIERAAQTGAATSALAGSPVVGVGLGFRFDWIRLGGDSFPTYTIDTGLSLAAKFGVIGLGLFGIAASAAVAFYRRIRPRLPEHARLSFVGYAAVSIALLPLGNPLEDKGFGLSVTLLIAWALALSSQAGAGLTTRADTWSRAHGSSNVRTVSRRAPST